jgi:hypothetical protein
MSKHTPGPWGVGSAPRSAHTNKDKCLYIHGADPYAMVCELGSEKHPEHQANARLIAAAPDLLAALRDVLRYCVTSSGLPDLGKGRTPEQQAAMNQARAAIEKAEGQ